MKRVACLLICLGMVLPAIGLMGAEGGDDEELDVITRADDGKLVRTKIASEDYIMVEGRYKHSAIKLPSYKVADILRANRPAEYDIGIERLKEERYAVAAKYFTVVLLGKDSKDLPWVAEYCNYRLGEAMYNGGFYDGYKGKTYNYSAPAEYYSEVLKANPKSRYLLDASVKLPICLIEQQKFTEAEKAFVAATAAIKQYREDTARTADLEYRKMADRAEAMLKLGNARLLEKKDKYAEAGDLYMTVQRTSFGKFPGIYGDAVDGELRCLVRQEKYADAKGRAESLIKKYQETHDQTLVTMLPGAYTVMGRASLAMAGEYEKNKNALQAQQAFADARWNYLQVLVQFFDRDEYMEEANYFVGYCYDKLKDQEPTAKDMAIRYWLNVKRNYPNGSFVKQASDDLTRVGYKETVKEEKKSEPTQKAEPAKKADADKKKAEPAKGAGKK